MNRFRVFALASSLALVVALPAAAQIPDKFENLQVLPKDITKQELVPIMRGIATGLGVRCNHCHVGPDNLREMDFKSDEKQEKATAREMMKMVAKINGESLANIKTGRETRVKVECVTCHHGVAVPMRIEQIVADTVARDGVEAAKTRYLELKEKYYGRAAYDFGAPPLTSVADDLAQAEKLDDALAVAEFAVEQNPAEVWPKLVVANLHAQRGEKEQAIAGLKKVLELDPENRMAKGLLQRLEAAE